MEDYFDIGYQLKPDYESEKNEWPFEYFYFGIFDGHGGCDAAKYAKEHLMKNITMQTEFWSDRDEDVLRSIQVGYAKTHEDMRKVMHKWPRTPRNHLPSTAGTTASILFIRNGKYYGGHVGDSRIVISRRDSDTNRWIANQITEDHKPESETELARIQKAGGDVKSKIGVHRVVWRRPVLAPEFGFPLDYPYDISMRYSDDPHPREDEFDRYPINESFVSTYQTIPFLAIARSLGDFWSINPYSGQYIVSPEPDLFCRPIDPNDECILLATDGLWSVVHSQQAVRVLEEFKAIRDGYDKRREGDYAKQYFNIDNFWTVSSVSEKDNYAFSLVYYAYQTWERRKLRPDNITAVVAILGDVLRLRYASHSAETRSLPETSKQLMSESPSCGFNEHYTRQIPSMRKYYEDILSDRAPKLELDPTAEENMTVYEHLATVLGNDPLDHDILGYRHLDVNLVFPDNYHRFSLTDRDTIEHDGFTIFVKRISDDPSDEELQPERPGRKSGVMVRDASAQCTQSIHDFNLDWPGPIYVEFDSHCEVDNEPEGSPDTEETDSGETDDYAAKGGEDDFDDFGFDDLAEKNPSSPECDTKTPLPLSIELASTPTDDGLKSITASKPITRRSTRESLQSSKNLEANMLQPRSENCESPKLERKTRRGAYLSVTSAPKRRNLLGGPKHKRRRSHPMHYPGALS